MRQLFLALLFSSIISSVNAAPYGSWYLDELGTASSTYALNDDQGSNDGIAYEMPSTGNATGKICSALDLNANSTLDYALINKDALDGAGDFTISIWHKGNTSLSKALLSGASNSKDNELLMWITNSGTQFAPTINGTSASAITIPNVHDNQWHHLSWRRAGSQSCIFIDGVNEGCETISSIALNIKFLVLGQDQDIIGGKFSDTQDWEGLLDEFLVHRSALTDIEIQSIYNNQNAGNNWDGTTRSCQTGTPPAPPADYGYSDWRFDEASWNGTANEVVDSHASNHGIGHSVTAVAGKICNAMDLTPSSTTDYAELGGASLDGVSDFTVSVWHKGSSSAGRSLLSGANTSYYNELIFWFSNTTTFNGHLNNRSLGGTSNSTIANNVWHHLVWRRIGTRSCFFMDSVLQGCQSGTAGKQLTVTSLILGQEQDNHGGGFDAGQDWEGLIDELLVFRRSLNNTEISDIYTNQNAGKNWDGSHRSCPETPAMKLTKLSEVISDPVNNITNPKRIPGAIVRYTIQADNEHATAGESIIIKDDLSSLISSGKIIWQGNITVSSPNINSGSTTAITDATGDDEGEFASDIITVRCGNISSSSPCIVTYDIQIVY